MPSLQNLRSPFRRVKGQLFLWDVAYFEHLIAELNALDPPPDDAAYKRVRELIKIFNESSDQITRSNLLELEQTLLTFQPTDALIQRAPILRLRYKEVVGDAQNAVYTPVDISKCAPGDEAIRKPLLQDLKNVVSGIHWRYVLLPLVERIEKAITTSVMLYVIAHSVLWAITLLITARVLHLPFLSMLATVVYGGIIGGYVSSLRRVQSIRPEFDSLMTIQSLQNSRYFLWLSPLLGSIFAVVLLLVFIARIVSGTVFPEFVNDPVCSGCQGNSWLEFWPFLKTLHPKDAQAYGLLFLWSFISGFAERFVPDILDRVVERGQSAAAQAAGATAVMRPPESAVVSDSGTGDKNGAGSLADAGQTEKKESEQQAPPGSPEQPNSPAKAAIDSGKSESGTTKSEAANETSQGVTGSSETVPDPEKSNAEAPERPMAPVQSGSDAEPGEKEKSETK